MADELQGLGPLQAEGKRTFWVGASGMCAEGGGLSSPQPPDAPQTTGAAGAAASARATTATVGLCTATWMPQVCGHVPG